MSETKIFLDQCLKFKKKMLILCITDSLHFDPMLKTFYPKIGKSVMKSVIIVLKEKETLVKRYLCSENTECVRILGAHFSSALNIQVALFGPIFTQIGRN